MNGCNGCLRNQDMFPWRSQCSMFKSFQLVSRTFCVKPFLGSLDVETPCRRSQHLVRLSKQLNNFRARCPGNRGHGPFAVFAFFCSFATAAKRILTAKKTFSCRGWHTSVFIEHQMPSILIHNHGQETVPWLFCHKASKSDLVLQKYQARRWCDSSDRIEDEVSDWCCFDSHHLRGSIVPTPSCCVFCCRHC